MTTTRVQILWQGVNNQTYHLTLDVSEKETHGLSAEVTDHPVESGVDFTDHIRPLPDTLTINGIISNTPIFLPSAPESKNEIGFDGTKFVDVTFQGPPRQRRAGDFVPLGLPRGGPIGALAPIGVLLSTIPITTSGEKATVKGFDPAFDRVRAAWGALRTIRDNGTVVSIVTTLHTYESMALQSVDVNRDAKSGNSLVMTITAKQIRIGRTEVVAVPSIPTQRKDAGRKVPAVVTSEPPDSESVAHKLFGN